MTGGPRLDGQVALVTGAASGIGAATAALLAERGASVFATDLRANETVFGHDVTDPAQWEAALAACVARFGRLDILVSNAGTAAAGRVAELSLETFRAQARVHVEGAFLGMKAAVAQFRRQGSPARGAIVVVASVAGLKPVMRTAAYGTAKAALVALAEATHRELAATGEKVRVHAVVPGGTKTPMTEALYDDAYWADPANFAALPLRDYCRPRDIAEAIAFLAAPETAGFPPAALVVDGGWMLSNRI
ncbi:MAG: SDR family NAD(P)-dependent oxidoreductase [Thermaurantiacus tibetensis]|uniref:SDR family NAD(P)-dependent oxidoreductase n=1 Tax=Thermaurantiacus tibetensis TaxID=2759035 RepID=UPI00188EB3BE|nr:SDR family oxidoreductase [Thermaurantiacus tibetensis]